MSNSVKKILGIVLEFDIETATNGTYYKSAGTTVISFSFPNAPSTTATVLLTGFEMTRTLASGAPSATAFARTFCFSLSKFVCSSGFCTFNNPGSAFVAAKKSSNSSNFSTLLFHLRGDMIEIRAPCDRSLVGADAQVRIAWP